jgi:glycine/D-amino acid oxidase-like deaminating enzyme
MLSFWERESFTDYDYIVVGGGIVGCSTAYHLKTIHPEASIAILERGIFPSGASSKNAGFACFGSLTELADDLPNLGADGLVALVKKRWEGLQLLREILGTKTIDFQLNRGYELIRAKEAAVLPQMTYFNDLLLPIFGEPVFKEEPSLVDTFNFDASQVQTIVSNQFEGQIDTGKMMQAWWELCAKNSIKLFTGCEVASIDVEKGQIRVQSQQYGDVPFTAKKIAICTNAFSKRFLPDEDIEPGRGMVIVTKPIPNLKFKGVFHYDEGYFYFRNIGERLLIGGGRNLDKAGEQTENFGINEMIKQQILHDIEKLILPGQSFAIDMEWSGIMAFGKNKAPIVKKIADNTAIGVRLGGMGVAIGTQVGKEISELLTRKN